jgi:type IV pilus assembly protein PilE
MKKAVKGRKSTLAGFSMIELLVTMAIVGIIASVAYPSYMESVRKARRSDATTTLLDIQLAQEKYRANNPSYTTSLSNLGFSGTDSWEGYYTLSVASASGTAFSASATPKSGSAQEDDDCSFTITQNGPDVSTSTKRSCWGK